MNSNEPKLLYTILCDEVRREDNGKWMFLGLFESIGVAALPATHPQCCIVNKWLGDDGSWTQRTRVVDSNHKVLAQSEDLPFELKGQNNSFTAVQLFQSLPLESEETLWIEILLGNEVKQRYPLRVAVIRNN